MTQGAPHRLHHDRKRSRSGSRGRDRRQRREKLLLALAGPKKSGIDRTIDLLLAALLIFAPFAFGAVEAWSEFVVLALAGAMATCLAVKFVFQPQVQVVWTRAYIPIAIYLLFILVQLIPLPRRLLEMVSPNTVALRHELMEDAAGPAPITFYPWASYHDLRLVIALAVVFFTVVNIYRHSHQITRLLYTVVAVGTAVMLLALLQDITLADNIYWIGPPGRGRANAGPFVTYNHFGQLANLTAGAALALLFMQLSKIFRRRGFEAADLFQRWRDKKMRPVWWLAGAVLLACVTIFFCQSRGAMIGMACGFVFIILVLSRAPGLAGKGWIMFPFLLLGVGAVLCLAPEAYLNRLESLESADSYADRLLIVKDLIPEFKQFPVFGTGLGSHEYIYPMYDHSTNLATSTHAENEYAQIIEETGLVGIALCVWFLTAIIARGIRAGSSSQSRMRMAAFGLGFGMTAILVQSFVDFGQHLPGVSVFTAVTCGVLISLGHRRHAAKSHVSHRRRTRKVSVGSSPPPGAAPSGLPKSGLYDPDAGSEILPKAESSIEGSGAASKPPKVESPSLSRNASPSPFSRRLRITGLAATVVVWGVIVFAANADRLGASDAEIASRLESGLAQNGWQGDNADFAELLSHAASASSHSPGNVKYRYSMNSYRWHAVSRVRDPESGNVVLTNAGKSFVDKIVSDLREARLLCPTYGPVYGLLGELEATVQGDPAGSKDIQSAFFLAQCSPAACNLAARQDAIEGRWDDAIAKFQRFLELAGSFDETARFLIVQMNRPDLALKLAGGNIGRLTSLVDMRTLGPAFEAIGADARTERFHLLQSECQKENPQVQYLQLLAEESLVKEDYQTAIECYQKAIVVDYGNVEIHLALCRSLTRIGQIADALKEAHKILRLQSQSVEAQNLVKELRAKNGGNDTE